MKKLFALLAGALCFGVVAAETAAKAENFLSDRFVNTGCVFGQAAKFAQLDNATRHAELERIAQAVKDKGTFSAKKDYAMLVTALFVNETEGITLEQAEAKYDEVFASLNPPATLTELEQDAVLQQKLCAISSPYPGKLDVQTIKALAKAAYEKYKGKVGRISRGQYGWIAIGANGHDLAEIEKLWGLPEDTQQLGNYIIMCNMLGKVTPIAMQGYYKGIETGSLDVALATKMFPNALSYAMEQENFDAAALKSKLNKAILIYKSKARQWKPTKEGEANPFIEFVGMLQDTAKDL